jgi:hypothetical protein
VPIFRYFLFVGGVLLALLFALDGYLPRVEPVVENRDVDRTIIRIHSVSKLPGKIVFDTAAPTTTSSPGVLAAELPETNNALAMMPEPPTSSRRTVVSEPAIRRAVHPSGTRLHHATGRVPQRRLAFDQHDMFARW